MRRVRITLVAAMTALALLAAAGAWTALPARAGLTFNGID